MKKEFEKEQSDNQIDDAFLDMPDMEDDEKFRQWLEEEYLKEADAIEESLFDGRKFEDNQDIVEKLSVSRESFYQRAREEGLLEDTADEKAEDEKNTEEAVPESMEKKILEFRKNAGVSKDAARDANRNFGKRKHSYVRFGRIAGIISILDEITDEETTEDYAEDTSTILARSSYLNLGNVKIRKVSSNEVMITGITQCHKKCSKVYLSLYLERKVNGSYGTYKYWNFTANNATSLSKTIDVAVPSGTYYRVRGYHAASQSGTKESTSTLTSGIMVK